VLTALPVSEPFGHSLRATRDVVIWLNGDRRSDLVQTGYRTGVRPLQPAAMTRSRPRRPSGRFYGSVIAAGHAGMWLAWPHSAAVMTVLDTGLAVTALTVIATALYAPDHISERAFRLLPWATKPTASEAPARRTA